MTSTSPVRWSGEVFLNTDNTVTMEAEGYLFIIPPELLHPLVLSLLAAAEIVKQGKAENERS